MTTESIASRRMSASEAAARLQIKRATLYSYVSRGLIPRQVEDGRSMFDRRDVEKLVRSSRHREVNLVERRRNHDLFFVTELTLIDGANLYYRGRDAIEMSRSWRFEDVAAWLWTGDDGAWQGSCWSVPAALSHVTERLSTILDHGAEPIERFGVAVALAAIEDDLRYDLSQRSVVLTGQGLIALLVDSLPLVAAKPAPAGAIIAERLWPRLTAVRPTPARIAALNAALVLMADHELAPSTFAARVAAAFKSNLYAVVSTGLGPTNGLYHRSNATEVESFLGEALEMGVGRTFGRRLQTGKPVEGFGQPLYPNGDPRGAELLSRLRDLGASERRAEVVERVLALGREREFGRPNAEFGLGALSFLMEMAPGSSQIIASLARTVGWIAHALEEYENRTEFRVRAAYLGPR